MKYIFNFENREKPMRFNREKLILSALQDQEQLYYMLDTQYEGIYQAEAVERKRLYGKNTYKDLLDSSKYRLLLNRKDLIREVFERLSSQKISVFRRGIHFYAETAFDELVPGDVVFLSPGDVIPADVRIIFSRNLEVEQSIYSDKNQLVRKGSSYDSQKIALENLIDIPNLCFVASIVRKGLARAVVVSTGRATYLGQLLLM